MTKEITFDRFVRLLGLFALLAVAYFLLRKLSGVLIPFVLAWLCAYLLYPIVCFFQYKCKLRWRSLSIIVTMLVVLVIIALLLWMVIPPTVNEVSRLSVIISEYVRAQTTDSNLPVLVEEYIKRYLNPESLSKMLSLQDVKSLIETLVPRMFSFVSGSIGTLIGFIASLIGIIYMFFILLDYEAMSHGVIKLVPPQQRKFVRMLLLDVERGMRVTPRTVTHCHDGWHSIQHRIRLIDFPMAIPLGLFIGLLNLVPYLQVIGFIPTIILAALKAYDTGQSFWGIILMALLVFAVVQALQDWVITPKVMGDITGLNAALILLALSIWGGLLGFVGLIIALPLTSLILSYYKRYVLAEPWEVVKKRDSQAEENQS
jgi:predicted PurR-regulated permease PerM